MVDIEVWEEGRTVPGGWRQDVTTAGGMMKAAFIHNNNNEKVEVLYVISMQNVSVLQTWLQSSGK
jgi:hypothetical protein